MSYIILFFFLLKQNKIELETKVIVVLAYQR